LADESGVTVRVFLSHDVDWSRRGPALDHVLARRDRFDEEILRRALEEGFNPYFGIPDVMEWRRGSASGPPSSSDQSTTTAWRFRATKT